MPPNGTISDVTRTLLLAIVAGAVIGAAVGLGQNWFGGRPGYLVPILAGLMGAGAAWYYRARKRRRDELLKAPDRP